MLYSFLISLVDQFSGLNVFRYLTFRTGLSVISSLSIVFLIGGPFIKFIESHKITGPIREDGPLDHIVKKVGTPTMGGILILIGILFGTLLWADLKNSYIWVLLFVVTSFGLLGSIDDYLKIKHKNSRGISSWIKFFSQITLSLIAIILLLNFGDNQHLKNLYFPFFKNLVLHLGLFLSLACRFVRIFILHREHAEKLYYKNDVTKTCTHNHNLKYCNFQGREKFKFNHLFFCVYIIYAVF